MDNPVLIRVAATLSAAVRHRPLEDLRQEGPFRYRFRFGGPDRPRGLLVSMRPETPWVVRPVRMPADPPRTRGPFLDLLRTELLGRVAAEIEKPTFDRWIRIRFQDGPTLVAELAPHGANLVLLDGDGRVVQPLRRTRRRADALERGAAWRPPPIPDRLVDPSTAPAAAIDACVERALAEGESPLDALRRRLFGLGTAAASLIVAEARGRDWGARVRDRLDALAAGTLDPVLGDGGRTLWPWRPADGGEYETAADAAATAGRFYLTADAGRLEAERDDGLAAILDGELDRLGRAIRRVRADLGALGDPAVHRRRAEALAAGLTRLERRDDDRWFVPDPRGGAPIEIPHRPGASPRETIDRLYARVKRAERGRREVDERLERLACRERDLRDVRAEAERLDGDALEERLRRLGVPVGIRPDTRAARASARIRRPRVEGLRMRTSRAGDTLLIGRNARENHHVTFRLAGPEDFWFHALGVTGAHVVVRNDERRPRPREETLEEAAAAAAWFSEARREAWVDVQWTRRKWVRKVRGGPPGAVILKRFETVRVRPSAGTAP